MSDYVPGSAYSEGFQARMKGVSKNTCNVENPVYIQEWLTGWEDAHTKIIEEARNSNGGCGKPKCCKNFIQD
jgi:ribosome modulation factor